MKSLVEEASTIGKAIETAWNRAGKPHSFSIKIFECPEYGFLGMTKKYGKIALFFEDVSPKERSSARKGTHGVSHDPAQVKKISYGEHTGGSKQKNHHPEVHRAVEPSRRVPEQVLSRKEAHTTAHEPTQKKKKESLSASESSHTWTEGMIQYVQAFTAQAIVLMGKPDVSFELKHEQANLKIIFHAALVADAKEHGLYKNLAHIMVTALRTKFKKEFKHLRLVLSRG